LRLVDFTGGSVGVRIRDNINLFLGSSGDFWHILNTADNGYEFWSTTGGGGSTNGMVYTVDTGTDTVDFQGSISLVDNIYLAPLDTNSWISAVTNASGIVVDYTFRVNGTNKLWSAMP